MLAESRIAAGDKDAAKRVYTHLRDTRRGTPDEYVCGIAEKGLAAAQ